MSESSPVATLLCLAFRVFWIILLIRVVMSWVELAGVRPPATGVLRSAYELLFDVTEPVLRPLRKIVPPAGMFDLSILIAFVIVFVLQLAFC
jgi:YggT family protein